MGKIEDEWADRVRALKDEYTSVWDGLIDIFYEFEQRIDELKDQIADLEQKLQDKEDDE